MSHPYKDLWIKGSQAPSPNPSKDTVKVSLSTEIIKEYIPIWNKVDAPKGIKYLALIMSQMEGFRKGSRSYKTNNPGNVGNVDSGKNRSFPTLEAGIRAHINHLLKVAKDEEPNYPIGEIVRLRPFYSKEIDKNKETYKLEPYCPGYIFSPYTGRLDEFIKIYSTGARQKNTYLSMIRSYFKNVGITITDATTVTELLTIA